MSLVVVVGFAAALVLALLVASTVGTSRFRDRYHTERADILRRARAGPVAGFDAASSARLPPPVQRYLGATRSFVQPAIKVAVLKQRGMLRAAADKPWMPFEAEQVYSMEPPGFVWLASARLAPLVHMLARDKFVDAKGNMLISLLGLFTVADVRGSEMDMGAGLRYWGEMMAFPEMLRSPHVQWEPLTEREARLTIQQDSLKLTAVIEFNDNGLPVATHAERYRDVGGTPVLTRWSGYTGDWRRLEGRLFPTKWESVWHLPEGDLIAVKIEILDLHTEPAGAPDNRAHAQAPPPWELDAVTHPETTPVSGD
jgi:hypothetical protein